MNDITRTSKDQLLTEIDNVLGNAAAIWPSENGAAEIRKLRRDVAAWRSTLEPCPGCAEFVRMQHDIASLLGVDADTDSIDLHERIYGALSSSQPPETARLTDAQCDAIIAALEPHEWCGFTRADIRLLNCTIDAARATATKGGEQG